jgi:magnesium transporter
MDDELEAATAVEVAWDPAALRGASVVLLGGSEPEHRRIEELPELLDLDGRFVWLDIPKCDGDTARSLAAVFGFHPLALRDCRKRNHVPKVHRYADHMFMIVHAVVPAEAGGVHLIELDQFVGRRYLVTVHGPISPEAPLSAAMREAEDVRRRIDQGRFRPTSPSDLSRALVSGIARGAEELLSSLATSVAGLERRVRLEDGGDVEALLIELFGLRHRLLALRTVCAQTREVYARWSSLAADDPTLLAQIGDVLDQFGRLRTLCDEEKDFLEGIVEFHQSRTATKMNIAMERLALIAAVLLPVTALASIYGMNLIVSDNTRLLHLGVVLALMGLVTFVMLRWTRRQGWW